MISDQSYSRWVKRRTVFLILGVILVGSAHHVNCQAMNHEPAGPSVCIGFINDNYTGNLEQGLRGRYFGADDFLTFSLLTQVDQGPWQGSLVYNMVTSRKLNFRYDLITTMISRTYHWRALDLTPGTGVIVRENLGGEELQNWFHGLTNIPEITLPFRESGVGLLVSGAATASLLTHQNSFGQLYSTSELRVTTGIVPSRLTQVFTFQSDPILGRIRLELRGGARLWLTEVDGYSQMLRSGVIGGLYLEGRVVQDLNVRFGVTLYPGQNLATDPLYKAKEFNYMPQIATTICWKGGNLSLKEYLKY